jgi:uncharacterized protein (TIGR02246 family)
VPAESPEQLSQDFATAINERDVDAAADLWREDAAIVQRDGQMTHGRGAVTAALRALMDNGVTDAHRASRPVRRRRRSHGYRDADAQRHRPRRSTIRAVEQLRSRLPPQRRRLADRA